MTYDEMIGLSHKVAIVMMFKARNCAPCAELEPIFAQENLARSDADMVVLQAEKHFELCRVYGVRAAPTVIAIYQGRELGRFSGALSAEDLRITLDRWGVPR